MAKALLRRGYELQRKHLVGSYLEKYTDDRPKWEAFTAAAEESNRLESYGDSMALGIVAPEPPALDRQNAHSEPGA